MDLYKSLNDPSISVQCLCVHRLRNFVSSHVFSYLLVNMSIGADWVPILTGWSMFKIFPSGKQIPSGYILVKRLKHQKVKYHKISSISSIPTVQTRVLTNPLSWPQIQALIWAEIIQNIWEKDHDSQTQQLLSFSMFGMIAHMAKCLKVPLKKSLISRHDHWHPLTVVVTCFSRSHGLNGPARSHRWLAQDHPHVRAGQLAVLGSSANGWVGIWTANIGILCN